MANNYFQAKALHKGVFNGRTLLQTSATIGGSRHVFVKLGGQNGGEVYPTTGAYVKNPFKGAAKAFAGDIFEYHTDGTGYILKTYLVKEDAAAAATEIKIVKDGFKHIPFVGDVLMVSPAKLTTKGKAVTVTNVKWDDDEWTITLNEALGAVKAGDILVEGAEAGASVLPRVTNPNAYFPSDADFIYAPVPGENNTSDSVKYFFTPSLMLGQTFLYENRMSPLPAAIKAAVNVSKVEGWICY